MIHALNYPPGQTPGTNTNDNAAAGFVGEYVSSTVASGSAVALTTATAKDVTTISLTPGDWDVSGVVQFANGAATPIAYLAGGVNDTANTLPGAETGRRADFNTANATNNALGVTMVIPSARFSLNATTTIRLIGYAQFASGTASAYGMIRARRVR
jgi:hypothetical protein